MLAAIGEIMKQQNIEVQKEVFDWYSRVTSQSARQTMTRAVNLIHREIEDHPVAGLFTDALTGAEFMLQTWRQIYRVSLVQIKGKFTRDELALFIDTHNGMMLSPMHFGSNTLAVGPSDAIALDNMAAKWGVDPESLLNKIHELSAAQQLCLEIWACGFWSSQETPEGKDFERYIDQLA